MMGIVVGLVNGGKIFYIIIFVNFFIGCVYD